MPTQKEARAMLDQARAFGMASDVAPVGFAVVPTGTADDLTSDTFVITPGLQIRPVPHPLLDAALTLAGAIRRGAMTYLVPLGDDNPAAGALEVLVAMSAPGTVYLDNSTHTASRARNLWEEKDTYRNLENLHRVFRGSNAAYVFPSGYNAYGENRRLTEEQVTRNEERRTRLRAYQPGAAQNYQTRTAEAYGLVAVTFGHGRAYIKFHTHQTCLPHEVVEAAGDVFPATLLNIREAGRPSKEPKVLRPIDALPVLEWLAAKGFALSDPHGVAGKIRTAAQSGVVAFPQPGRPAYTTVYFPTALSATFPPDVRETFHLPDTVAASAASVRGQGTAAALADLLVDHPDLGHTVHPGTEDIVAMIGAAPHVDDRLHDYQQDVVGLHQSTDVGLVVALDPGMGKTITTLVAVGERAKANPRHRHLVVTEASLRHQWAAEVAKWLPEATVATVTTPSDVPDLVTALENTEGLLVVITSYAQMRHVHAEMEARVAEEEPVEVFVEDVNIADDDQLDLAGVLAALEQAPAVEQEPPAVQVDLSDQGALFGAEGVVETDEVVQPADPTIGSVLLDTRWHDFTVDEAEPLRGTSSKAAKGCWGIRNNSDVATVLTGTPINKGVDDLGRLVSFARNDPALFDGNLGGVKLSASFDMASDEDLPKLQDALGPVVYRRTTSESTGKMPSINPTVCMLDPTAEELALDAGARGELKRAYENLIELTEAAKALNPDSEEYKDAAEALRKARGAWLGGTTLARQAASDPAALLGSTSGAAQLLAAQGLIAAANANPGTKRTAAVADIVDRVEQGEFVLVFTEFSTVAHGLIADLDLAGVRVGAVLGGGGLRRDKMVQAFQRGHLDVLVCTASAEKGLNLQKASTIVHYDLPWTPKGVIQRTGRARRLASDNDVLNIVFYVMRHTIEERVAALVVSRAVESMRALDTSRGLEMEETDMGSAFSGIAIAAASTREGRSQSVLMEVTRQLVTDDE